MAAYSIKDLERLSGIKAHTIRMWERRYGLVEPKRTESNIRYYTNEELKRLLNVAILNNHGYKISRIVGMSPEDMHRKVLELSSEELSEEVQIESLVVSMVDMDEARFERILANSILRLGFEQTVINIIYPFFKKVGILWQTGAISPAQEHFISNLVRQKLIVAIDGQGMMTREGAKRFLLFLPENELHELGLLFYSYLIKKAGHKVFYLGQSVPVNDLVSVCAEHKPHYLITSLLSYGTSDSFTSVLDTILKLVPDVPVFVVSRVEEEVEIPESTRVHVNIPIREFQRMIEEL